MLYTIPHAIYHTTWHHHIASQAMLDMLQ
jgi:hypothetical protein